MYAYICVLLKLLSCFKSRTQYTCVWKQSYQENTGRFIMFSVITNIYNKKTIGPTLMEFFTTTGKLKKFFF